MQAHTLPGSPLTMMRVTHTVHVLKHAEDRVGSTGSSEGSSGVELSSLLMFGKEWNSNMI